MSVHGLAFVGILFTQSHICYFLPVTGGCFAITILYGIKAMCLDVVEKADGIVQGFLVACSPMVFAQSVDGKSEGIDLFLGVAGYTVAVQGPIDASVFLVEEIVDDDSFGTGGYLQIVFPSEQTIRRVSQRS